MYTKVVGRAPINIALIKYWGKKDEKEVIPFTPSISLSLAIYETITEISYHDEIGFSFLLNDQPHEKTAAKVYQFLKNFTDDKTLQHIHVNTKNSGPTAAGLASSASGFAALAITANHFFQTQFTLHTLASITRKGSGSAIRSLLGTCVMWDEHGQITPIDYPFEDTVMGIIIINSQEKKMGSTEAMKLSVETSPLYASWITQSFNDTQNFLQALNDKDFHAMGLLSEDNALRMHEVARHSNPPIEYLTHESYHMIEHIKQLRTHHPLEIYATMDAGPNVKILTRKANQTFIHDYFKQLGIDIIWSEIDQKGAYIIDAIPID